MKKRIPVVLATLMMCLGACNSGGSGMPALPDIVREYELIPSETLYTKKVENMPNDFIMGMDASSVLSEEESGVVYRDFDGNVQDLFKILSDNGVNYIRVRVWNNPYDHNGKGFGGGNLDIDRAVEIGKRATKYNMKLLVDFHYSDFWADPAKQKAPRAWQGMKIDQKSEALYQFTKDSLQKFRKAGVVVGMVQVGNETNGGKMAGEIRFAHFAQLFNSGAKAVREVYPDALVACHFANPEKSDNYLNWARDMKNFEVDYDVFGSSYYPYWHGTLENLSEVLSTIAETYDKKTMVMETSYAFSTEDFDFGGNTIGATGGYYKPYPFTIAGQANHVRDVTDTMVNKTKNGIGICYWEGTWISVGSNSWEENSPKWEQYGSGWAATPASIYDEDVSSYGAGGSMVDNQCFFKTDGTPLESLKVFNNVRFGNDAPKYIDGIQDAYVSYYNYEDFELPETVEVIYSDNSRTSVPVVWDDFDIAKAKADGNAKYDIKGTAEGYRGDVYCHLTIMEYNYIENYSFEDNGGSNIPWVVTNNSETPLSSNYIVKITNENPQTGKYAFHFWAKDENTVNFNVEQPLTLEQSGTYKFQASLLGGDDKEFAEDLQDIYIYVKINGEIAYKQDMKYKGYNAGYSDFVLKGIEYELGQEISVGFHVEAKEMGAWGDIDDCMFNIVL